MELTIAPRFWRPEWLSTHKRLRKSMYPTPEEKVEKKEQYLQKKIQEQKLVEDTRKNNTQNLSNWLEINLSKYEPQYQPKRSHSTSFLGNNSHQQLRTRVYKKFKVSFPELVIDTNQVAYLLDKMDEEDKIVRLARYCEERKLEEKKSAERFAREEERRREDLLKVKEWKEWYQSALGVTLEPRTFKTELSAKKARKRDLGKMEKMYFFRYILGRFDRLSEFSNLSEDVLIRLYRVKLAENKINDKKLEIDKVLKFIEREKKLEETCLNLGVNYIKYIKLPGKRWTKSKKWTHWSEEDTIRKKNINKNIVDARRNIEWNKLSIEEKNEVIEFYKEWKRLESEHFKSLPDPQPRYRPLPQQKEVIYTDTGHSLTIDPKWSPEKRMEEIESFKQAVRDF